MGLKYQNWQHSLALFPWVLKDVQDVSSYEMCLPFISDDWPCKADVLKIAWGGVEGQRNVSEVVHFGGICRLVLGAILKNFISLSI